MNTSVAHLNPKLADDSPLYDLAIIGGGINGAGIAADASGRGLKVLLSEQADFASATSSASSKLIHGGLRYLEHYEFRLVREALAEREVLLNNAPHLIKPMRFILPHRPHLRPAWMIRIGLFLYDHLAHRGTLPGSRGVRMDSVPANPLKPDIDFGFEYSDCRVDDSRLVLTNALTAQQQGARILSRTRCQHAWRKQGLWHIALEDTQTGRIHYARSKALVNATGPWAQQFIETKLQAKSPRTIKLIKGSHFVVPRLYDGDHAYILQNQDQRIVFVIPYLDDFTLIGTTDKLYQGDPRQVAMDSDEEAYLLAVVNEHFSKTLNHEDIVWRYAGVRPLCDDESTSPSAMTRDYTLELEADDGNKAPLLSIFGGKITTYRKLSEAAMQKLAPYFPTQGKPWTARTPIAGAAFGEAGFAAWQETVRANFDWVPETLMNRWINAYGTRVTELLGNAETLADLGNHFGHDLYAAEVDFLIATEWARHSEDILWRRSKLGLYLTASQSEQLEAYVSEQVNAQAEPSTEAPERAQLETA